MLQIKAAKDDSKREREGIATCCWILASSSGGIRLICSWASLISSGSIIALYISAPRPLEFHNLYQETLVSGKQIQAMPDKRMKQGERLEERGILLSSRNRDQKRPPLYNSQGNQADWKGQGGSRRLG